MEIDRIIKIEDNLEKGKVLAIFGPRQCGKTYLVQKYLEKTKERYIFESGNIRNVQEKFLDGPRKEVIDDYGLKYDLVVIDEAQLVPNIGETMKVLVDLYPNIKVILTGSSSLDLSGQIGEPLLGRQRILNLFPIWEQELLNSKIDYTLEERLLYGSYPEIIKTKDLSEKRKKLEDLANANLFKDVLSFDRLKKPKVIIELVKLLALNMGSEVSVLKLARDLLVDQKTIEKYLDLLEKTYIIFSLAAFSKNENGEIRKKKKYYFYDLGIRNVMADNFSPLNIRRDAGAVWENFCIVERLKRNKYQNNWAKQFFWRTNTGVEVDYIETENENIFAFEIKITKNNTSFKTFLGKYPQAKTDVITRENYRDFIC